MLLPIAIDLPHEALVLGHPGPAVALGGLVEQDGRRKDGYRPGQVRLGRELPAVFLVDLVAEVGLQGPELDIPDGDVLWHLAAAADGLAEGFLDLLLFRLVGLEGRRLLLSDLLLRREPGKVFGGDRSRGWDR